MDTLMVIIVVVGVFTVVAHVVRAVVDVPPCHQLGAHRPVLPRSHVG